MDAENLNIPSEMEDMCSMTMISDNGREFICILPRHKKVYERRKNGGQFQHYMVNRWPHREQPGNTI